MQQEKQKTGWEIEVPPVIIAYFNSLLGSLTDVPLEGEIVEVINKLLKDVESHSMGALSFATYIVIHLAEKETNEDFQPNSKEFCILLACLRVVYQTLRADTSVLSQIESTIRATYKPAAKVYSHIGRMANLAYGQTRNNLKVAQSSGIFAPEDYHPADLANFLEGEYRGVFDASTPCDLLLHFPRPAYTPEAHVYAVEKMASIIAGREPIPKDLGRVASERPIIRLGEAAGTPLAIVEGRTPEQIKAALERYRGRIKNLFISAHGGKEGMAVCEDKDAPLAITRDNLREPWVAAILNCHVEVTSANRILLSCETGREGGIAEVMHANTGVATWAPEEVVSNVFLQKYANRPINCQFFVAGPGGLYPVEGKRF